MTRLLRLTQVNLVDNELSISVKQGYAGRNSANITTIVSQSSIRVASRPDCDYCYGNSLTSCSNGVGIKYGSTTLSGGRSGNADQVDSPPAYDTKLFVINSRFNGFQSSYSGNLSGCRENKVFQVDSQSVDSKGSINLIGSTCTNCELPKSLITFPRVPTDSTCGDTPCSGLANYYIRDNNLVFSPGSALFYVPQDAHFAAAEGCVLNADIQGYLCNRNDIGVLQFESISRDFDSRTVWPVTLAYDTAKWTSTINAPKKWDNFNRVARFAAMLVTGERYQLSFNGQAPSDMRFSMQQKSNVSAGASDFVVINMTYQISNIAARVSVSELKRDPLLASGSSTTADYFSTCGANKYFQQNGTLSFVVTDSPTCEVRVKLVSSVSVSTTIASHISIF